MDNEIKNFKGQVIGYTQTQEGIVYAYDKQDNVVGSFNPKTNTTYSKNGTTIGVGNQLSALLYK